MLTEEQRSAVRFYAARDLDHGTEHSAEGLARSVGGDPCATDAGPFLDALKAEYDAARAAFSERRRLDASHSALTLPPDFHERGS